MKKLLFLMFLLLLVACSKPNDKIKELHQYFVSNIFVEDKLQKIMKFNRYGKDVTNKVSEKVKPYIDKCKDLNNKTLDLFTDSRYITNSAPWKVKWIHQKELLKLLESLKVEEEQYYDEAVNLINTQN